MADIKNITIDGTTYGLKDDKARNDITDLKEDINEITEEIGLFLPPSGSATITASYSPKDVCTGLTINARVAYTVDVQLNQIASDGVYVQVVDSSNNVIKTFNVSNNETHKVFDLTVDSDYSNAKIITQAGANSIGTTVTVVLDCPSSVSKIQELESSIDIAFNSIELYQGKGNAVSPAYTLIPIISFNAKKDIPYLITAEAETNLNDYAVYIRLYNEDTQIKQVSFTHTTGETSFVFQTNEDATIDVKFVTSATSGLKVYAVVQKNSKRSLDLFTVWDKFLYHHLNQELNSPIIPAQSLLDIEYAYELGFSLIEANVHKCSDGVYVCKHGVSGKLGYGLKALDGIDYSNTSFSDITSSWLRQNIVYNSPIAKNCVPIPTLDEFCAECKNFGLKILLEGSEEVLGIARKYLTDNDIVLVSTDRSYGFNGTIEYVKRKTKDIDDAISECVAIGNPLYIVIASGEYDQYTESELKEIVLKAHNNGFSVGIVYPTPNLILTAKALGFDSAGSTGIDINPFIFGTKYNITELNDSHFALTDSVYDASTDTITMQDGGKIVLSEQSGFKSGVVSVSIRYNGEISITPSSYQPHNLMEYTSTGEKTVTFSYVLQQIAGSDNYTWLEITSVGVTDVLDIDVRCSLI